MNTNHKARENPDRSAIPDDMLTWLEELPETERKELEETWHVTTMAEDKKPDLEVVEAAWVKVQASMREHRPVREKNRRIDRGALARRRRTTPVISVVSLVTVGIIVSIVFWPQMLVLETVGTNTLVSTLSDGTVVELNRNTRLTYNPGLFWQGRTTQLEGEAFFDVVPDRRAFVVETFNARVRVLGTRLNVRAYREEDGAETQVFLETGAAELISKSAAENKVVLDAGQMSRLSSDSHTPTPPSRIDFAGPPDWRDRGMYFSTASLDEVFEAIETRFGVEIKAGENIRQDTISLFIPEVKDAETLLADLCTYIGYRYRRIQGGYQVVDDTTDR